MSRRDVRGCRAKVVGRGHPVKVEAHRVAGRSLVDECHRLGQARVHRQHAIGQRSRRASDLESSSSLPCWLRPRQRALQPRQSRQAPREHCARLPDVDRQTREGRHLNGAGIADGRGRARPLELTGIRASELESSSSLPRCLAASLPRCLAASLPRCLAASLPRCLVGFAQGSGRCRPRRLEKPIGDRMEGTADVEAPDPESHSDAAAT
jgi:hypothetical protein